MKRGILEVRTPEGVVFSQPLAGPVIRCAAWFVDLMTISALMTIPGLFVNILHLFSEDTATAFYVVCYFAISIGYGMAAEWLWRGQTLGKKLFRLRVVDAEGLSLTHDQIVIRNLLRFVDLLPAFYLVGGLSCWLSRKNQRLGDIAANTIVVHIPHILEPDIDQLFAGKFNSLRQYPHLEARLRQAVSPTEAALALQALIRREEFLPPERIALFAELAGHFSTMVEFPAEAVAGISDEQYVRNVVDVLYRTQQGRRKRAPAFTGPSLSEETGPTGSTGSDRPSGSKAASSV